MKKLFVVVLAAAMAFALSGTGIAATGDDATLRFESGVSFGQSPVISGKVSGETLYIVSGGYSQADMVLNGGATVYEVSPVLTATGTVNRNVAWALGRDGNYDAATGATVSPSSPVLIDNGTGGNSIFMVQNVYNVPEVATQLVQVLFFLA
jgi:hypothetical protein